jgi:hypothetical protein
VPFLLSFVFFEQIALKYNIYFFGGIFVMKKTSTEMKKILFANTRKYIIEEGSLTNPDNVLLALTVNKKLEAYGMSLDSSAIRALSTQTANEMAQTWKEMEAVIRDVTGAEHFNGQLFYANFPEEVMGHTEAELYLNSMFYYTFSQSNDKLSQAIANELHSMISEEKKERLPLLEQFPRELKLVNKGTEQDLFKMMDARMHSLNMSEQQFEELKRFSEAYTKEFDDMLKSETPFQSKETKVKLAMMLHENGRDYEVKMLLRDSVDVLRFAAMLSKKNGMTHNTVELKSTDPKKQVAFKLHGSEKKLVRSLLNECNGLYTDIWRQEKLFKNLMNRLGTTKADNCPVRVTLAFDNLALGHKVDEQGRPIYNPNKLIPESIEHLNKTGDASKLERVAKDRPGDFLAMYISSVEKTKPEYRDSVINAIQHCAASDSVTLKRLLTTREQVELQAKANEKVANGTPAAKVYKHHGNKHYIKVDTGKNLSSDDCTKMKDALMKCAGEMVRGYQDLGQVYIDPTLAGVKAPGREMRDASGGAVLTPYSTIDLDGNKNLMVFGVRWERTKENPHESWIDVDLSVHMYGANYEDKGYVSYSNLRSPAAIHSGDYTEVGPSGSSTEAIIADKTRLREMGVKYLVAEVHCYSIESFRKAGNCKFVYEQKEGSFGDWTQEPRRGHSRDWNYNPTYDIVHQSRDDGNIVFLGETFEPSQLENCIMLNSDGKTTVPLFVDVENGQIHWLDMTLEGRGMPHVTEDPRNMTSVMAEMERSMNNPYPDMKSLFESYAMYNGEIVQDIREADTVFVRENVDREKLEIKEEARVITGFDLDVISDEFSGNKDRSVEQKEEPLKVQEEKAMVEPPLVKQFRYLHGKLDEFPRGAEWQDQRFVDDLIIDRR